MAWTENSDGSIVDQNGKVIFFSLHRFINDICLGDCCFICGSRPGEKEFNDEHVFPEWLLRKYNLFARVLTLPNSRNVRYDRHTVPCCAECNSLMGNLIEERISAAVNGGLNQIGGEGALELFVWIGLIYLKLHLKDKANRKHLDMRVQSGMIADDYEWKLLHHLHTIVRCFFIPTMIEPSVFGSMLVLPCRQEGSNDEFDFGDLHIAQTMMLRLGSKVIFVVFNDSGGALRFFQEVTLDKIKGPISELQAREIMCDLAMLNLHLKERPVYRSDLDVMNEEHKIVAQLPSVLELENWNYELRGRLMWRAFKDAWQQLRMAGSTEDEVKRAVMTGKLTVLFDDKGNFATGKASD
jgi:hypothetical protein